MKLPAKHSHEPNFMACLCDLWFVSMRVEIATARGIQHTYQQKALVEYSSQIHESRESCSFTKRN